MTIKEEPLTRAEALEIIARIARGEIDLWRGKHFNDELRQEGYIMLDVRAVLRTHKMEAAPAWDEEHYNYRVELLGKCLQGRLTRLVLGLRREGPQMAITIMEEKSVKPKRTWRKR